MNQKLQKLIKARNDRFKGKTKAEKRVLVAKDVIQQIKLGRIIPQSRVWISIRSGVENISESDSVQECLLENKTTCKCCALGAIFASRVMDENDLLVGETLYGDIYLDNAIDDNDKNGEKLTSIFTKKQLRLIELAFEGGEGAYYANERSKKEIAAENYCRKLEEKPRLIKIMRNIIRNNGIFDPFDKR